MKGLKILLCTFALIAFLSCKEDYEKSTTGGEGGNSLSKLIIDDDITSCGTCYGSVTSGGGSGLRNNYVGYSNGYGAQRGYQFFALKDERLIDVPSHAIITGLNSGPQYNWTNLNTSSIVISLNDLTTSCADSYSALWTDAGNGTNYTSASPITLSASTTGGGTFQGSTEFFANATNALKNGKCEIGVGVKSDRENDLLVTFSFSGSTRFTWRYPYVTINNSAGGTTTPASGFRATTNPVRIQANPSLGYHFKSWTNGSTTNPIDLVVANQDVTTGAMFEADVFSISGTKNPTIPEIGSTTYYYMPLVNGVDPSVYGYSVSMAVQNIPSNCTGAGIIYSNPTKGAITLALLQPQPDPDGYWGTPAGQIIWTATFTKAGVTGSRTASFTAFTPNIGNPRPGPIAQ